jgi:hypothetical protein
MFTITIPDLLTKTSSELSEIQDGISPMADAEYVEKKIMSPLISLANIVTNSGYKYLSRNLGDPLYSNLQTLLNASTSTDLIGVNVSAIVNILKQPPSDTDATVSINRNETLITSPNKEEFYILVTTDISGMNFDSVTLKVSPNVTISNCYINNCKIIGTGITKIDQCTINNSEFAVQSLLIKNLNTLRNTYIDASSDITFDTVIGQEAVPGTSKMYNCIYNKLIINPLKNITQEFNVYIQNI